MKKNAATIARTTSDEANGMGMESSSVMMGSIQKFAGDEDKLL
jgi:hypothetical protein